MSLKTMIAASVMAVGMSVVGAGAAVAGETTQTEARSAGQQPTASRRDPSRRVCRSQVPTGSRLTIRTCRTQAEWDEQAEQAREAMGDQNETQRVQPAGSSGPF